MTGTILVINAGSSSVKFALFGTEKDLPLLAGGKVSAIGEAPVFMVADEKKLLPAAATYEDALQAILQWIESHHAGWVIRAAGHRIVHGGNEFTRPVRLDETIIAKLRALSPLAPLHQPHNLAAVDVLAKLKPGLPQVACFDTAFHAGHTPLFSTYALPQDLRDKGVKRYGFHGLSYEWIAHVLKRDHPALAQGRVIAAHLGNGASLCALQNGKSVDTTMGMTALEGLPMGTRCGGLDPGALIYMIRDCGLSPDRAEHILYNQSGLKGLSGISNDVKTLLASPDPGARFALDYFALKVAQYMGMMAVALGGVDGIVFTGGIGEHAAPVRNAVLKYISFLEVKDTLVIPANEERIIAGHVKRVQNKL